MLISKTYVKEHSQAWGAKTSHHHYHAANGALDYTDPLAILTIPLKYERKSNVSSPKPW